MRLAYERWQASARPRVPIPASRALHAARLDSFLADTHNHGVIVIDIEGVVVDCNLALLCLTDYGRSEVLGRSLSDMIVPEQRRRIQAAISDALAGDGVRARADGMKRSGETCELAITFIPLFDDERAVVGAVAITEDFGETQKAERERDGSLLALASRVASFIGWSIDLDSGAFDWSDDLPGLRGHTPRDLDELHELLSTADAARLARALDRSAREQRTLDLTLALLLPFGERHLRLIGRIADSPRPGSRVPRVISGAAHDVTEAVLEQRQRLAVEELLLRTVNAMTDGFAVMDDEWRVSFVNDRMVDFVGRDRAEIIGKTLWEVLPEIIGTGFEQVFRDAVEQSTTVHAPGWSADRQAWLNVIVYPTGSGLAVHLRDITETETARRAYDQAQAQLATLGRLLDISRDAIVVRDLEHRIQYANAGAIALFGGGADAVIGADQLLEVDREQRARATAAVLAQGHWAGRFALRTPDGRDRMVATRWQLMRDEAGEPKSIMSVTVDITEELVREEALRRAERLDSLGTFASGIAHDLNNVLTPITLAAQLLGRSLADTPEAETAEMIETAARRGAEMVQKVLTFARGVESGTDRVDVGDLLAELERMVSDTLAAGISFVISPPPPGTAVIGDATQLLQVLANLVSNANDAITAPGAITVDARLEPHGVGVGQVLVIDVIDTGHGISPDVIDRLWEPFFTTKPVGKGTGLGLTMAAATVRAFGGSIDVDSDGRAGSRFTLTFPVADAAFSSSPVAFDDDLDRGDGRTILVVDDESSIRRLVRQLLVAHGYRVVLAHGGHEAQRQLTAALPVDLVLSDVTMPDGDGVELLQWLISSASSVPIVLMSGREDAGSIPDEFRARTSGFLVKPLTTTTLLMAVHTALDRHPRGGRA